MKCVSACLPGRCEIGNPEVCLECTTDEFFLPECTSPKSGFMKAELPGGLHEYRGKYNWFLFIFFIISFLYSL